MHNIELGDRKGVPTEEADILLRISRYNRFEERTNLESHFLTYGSTVRIQESDGSTWVIDLIEIVEKKLITDTKPDRSMSMVLKKTKK